MTFKPMIISGPMMAVYLAGNKTMTRRLVKPQPWRDRFWWERTTKNSPLYQSNVRELLGENMSKHAPIQPGDFIWWREKWQDVLNNKQEIQTIYAADYSIKQVDGLKPWKSSIHMPKRACRAVAEVVEVGAGRVQEISEEDSLLEGFEFREHFIRYWNSLHGSDAWERNEWVWGYRFRPLKDDELKEKLEVLNGRGTKKRTNVRDF